MSENKLEVVAPLSDEERLRAEIRELKTTNRALTDRNADLQGQIDWKSKARLIGPAEDEGIASLRQQFEELNNQQNSIVKYIRENFGAQIARGEHAGMSLADIVKRYMERGRLPWWKRILG